MILFGRSHWFDQYLFPDTIWTGNSGTRYGTVHGLHLQGYNVLVFTN